MKNKTRFVYETRPLALPQNMVVGKSYRFTVLTPSLIRMEYDKNGVFEDRASQSVFFRDFPRNDYEVTREDGCLKIETSQLFVVYRENEYFDADTLQVHLKAEPASTWNYGEDFEDLGGTAKTLDTAVGRIPLEHGVCSRNGFSIMDDTKSMLLNEQGWVEARTVGTIDCYFWGYGFRYLEAVKDLYRLTGAPPMLPAYALGNWWSRYHAYTQQEYQELIERFEKEEIPFSVSVVDMDWHITDVPQNEVDEVPVNGEGNGNNFYNGWTGYTWNKDLFPDYKGFLKFLKEHNLKTSLNLHPAAGVRWYEQQYEEMARACGIDPFTKQRVLFDVLSQDFMEHYFDILHHPYEEDGVDFWWMDWQQGTSYWWIHGPNEDGVLKDPREILDPLWMLNHLHIADIRRNGKRPMFFSRYSGIGSHRYPVGFSGDTYVNWSSLDFQPYFTATASNVGYSWWSHDIGGHMHGYRDNELTTRWVQLGVFSPINRLHSCNEDFVRKEPWCYEPRTENILKDWLRLRHHLFPYIYTMNYRNHAELEPLVQPMYYAYPKKSGAYEAKNQFLFGSELMVAPITGPNNKITQMGSTDVWFPRGDWFDFFEGTHYTSKNGRVLSVHREIQDYPVFARAGAIVPMQRTNELKAGEDLDLVIFPGATNQDEDEKMEKIASALSAKTRRDILRVVNDLSYNISEIAQKLDLPISTVAFHVKHLKEAGLVSVQERMMTRGVEKVISHAVDQIVVNCTMARQGCETTSTKFQIPIGSYTDCKVGRTCGMASAEKMIGIDDTPSVFYSVERIDAQIIWLTKGYLEYRIPNYYLANEEATELIFSAELCSEAPNYRNDWASDITFWVNGHELCTWTSPGDFGGRRGRLNPDWWLDISTQYGVLKTIRINQRGVYLDEQKMSSMKISQLSIEEGDYFTIRIGIKPDAQNVCGFNIFGEKFGDYEQAINVRIEHKTKKEEKRDDE